MSSFRAIAATEPGPAALVELTDADLGEGDVTVSVAYSSLNYKDALASQGHPGVVRSFPHVPGIDCAGRVAASTAAEYCPSDPVLVTLEFVVPLPTNVKLPPLRVTGLTTETPVGDSRLATLAAVRRAALGGEVTATLDLGIALT